MSMDRLGIEEIFVEGMKDLMPFYMGKYPITQEQWEKVMGSNPSYFKGKERPVENVSYNDAEKFIEKLNDITERGYRLPTEEEWEYAARGGNRSKGFTYAGSNNLDEVGWYDENAGSKTHPVGEKKPNELGLYDMSGNVWEWCCDEIRGNRVCRGGSWISDAQYCHVAFRGNWYPPYRHSNVSFRLVRNISKW